MCAAADLEGPSADSCPCPSCGSTEQRLLFGSTLGDGPVDSSHFCCTSATYGVHGPIVRCVRCGFTFIADTAPVADAYEDVEDPEYVAEEAGRLKTFSRYLSAVARHAPRTGRLLEVGAYTGLFLSMARDAGWDVAGVEPSAWAVRRAASEYGLTLTNAPFAEGLFEPSSFDAVVMWDVIEHVDDPRAVIATASACLRPGGLLAVSTMDIGSLAARVSGHRWPWLMEMHRVYFSRATMRRMLEEQGLRVVQVRPHIRWISWGYLADRMELRLSLVGRALGAVGRVLHTSNLVVPFYIGDLFEVYAIKP